MSEATLSAEAMAWVEQLVASAPPLTDRQRARISALINPTTIAGPDGRPLQPTQERCAIYRYYDRDDQLLYVGMTTDLDARARSHDRNSRWMEFAARRDVEWLPSRDDALAAEQRAIKDEAPIFNKVHGAPETKRAAVAYLIARDALHLLTAT